MPMMFPWKKTKLQKKRVRKKTKQKPPLSMWQTQLLVGLSLVFLLSVLGTTIWYGTRISSLQITQVEVLGGYTIPHSEISQKVQASLEGTYFKLIPKSFRPLYPKGAIYDVLQTVPRIKNISIEVVDTQKLIVIFDEYKPAALWCKDVQTDLCFFMDAQGFSFVEAPVLTGSAFVRYIDNKRDPKARVQAFDTEFITDTQTFASRLANELDLYVTYIERKDDLDILYTVSGGGVLKVSQSMTPEKSFKNLQTILNSEDFVHLQNGKFRYIDLRFGDKIFLNEENEKEDVSTSTENQ